MPSSPSYALTSLASPCSFEHLSSLAPPLLPFLLDSHRVSSKSTDVNVFVVGALGLRFDHCMANIHMLFKYSTGFRRLILLGTESMAFLLQVGLGPVGLSYYKRRTDTYVSKQVRLVSSAQHAAVDSLPVIMRHARFHYPRLEGSRRTPPLSPHACPLSLITPSLPYLTPLWSPYLI